MSKQNESSITNPPREQSPLQDRVDQILAYGFRNSKEGMIAVGRSLGASTILFSDIALPVTAETARPIDIETDPRLIKPFKKWLKQNEYTGFDD
jgi:hypothetical protein